MEKISDKIDLSSFDIKDTLNPSIFDLEDLKMKKEVRESLLKIANDFYNDLTIDIDLSDIWLTGSLANFNWSEYSDLDLHIIVPYEKAHKNKDLIEDYFYSKKSLWNDTHNIQIEGYDVEMYVQDMEEKTPVGEGIYSILYNSWVKEPEKKTIKIDKEKITKNVAFVTSRIKMFLAKHKDPKDIDNLMDFIYAMRKKGLDKEGEFSPKNLAFKFLRRKGVLDKLKALKTTSYDRNLSIGGRRKKIGSESLTSYKDSDLKEKDKDGYTDGINYSIHGVMYPSLRKASEATGEKKSTIAYRVKSKNPKYSDYKTIYSK